MTTRQQKTDRDRSEGLLVMRAGAAAVVALALALYVSFTAIDGLPWQSTYDIAAQVPNAARLVPNDTVRLNGVRVGRVKSVEAQPASASRPPFSLIRLALDDDVGELPTDTRVRTRAASLLGASYVALEPGRAKRTLKSGGILPLANATRSVDVTDLFEVFDARTSRRIQTLIGRLGEGFAGRGPALGQTVTGLSSLLTPAERVARTLASSRTRLPQLIQGYGSFTRELGGVSDDFAGLMRGGGATFTAIAAERRPLARTLDALAPAERSLTAGLRQARPALDRLAKLAVTLRPAARRLRPALTATEGTLESGTRTLRVAPEFAARLQTTLDALGRASRQPATSGAVRKLNEGLIAAAPLADTLGEAQIHCNVMANGMIALAALTSGWSALGPNGSPPLNLGYLAVTHLGAQGEVLQQAKPSSNVALNYLPNENAEECEAGNEIHDGVSQALGSPPGSQGTLHPTTSAPPDALRRAKAVGLLDTPEGWRP